MSSARPPTSHAFYIPSLDGIRAASFLMVFLGHTALPWVPIPIPGGFGVSVFFFLSGYLITTLLRGEIERTKTVDFRSFYIRRALRIWPPFYLVLCVGIALTFCGVIAARLESADVAAQALHFYNYWTIFRGWRGVVPGTGVYWSLAVEEHFYLLFPLLYLQLNRARMSPERQLQVFVGICALVLAWRCALVFGWHEMRVGRTGMATDTRIDSILFGCCLAVYKNPALEVMTRKRPHWNELLLLAVSTAILLLTFVWRDEAFRETFRYTIQGMALYPLFRTAVRFPSWGPFWLLNLRPVRFLGTLSYGMYLVHHTLIEALYDKRHGLSEPTISLAALALSILLAWLIWYFVEQPSAKLRRVLQRSQPVPSAVAGHGTSAVLP
jgi:peptidoglycan/LPS O-acetylase OafA/YrhL